MYLIQFSDVSDVCDYHIVMIRVIETRAIL